VHALSEIMKERVLKAWTGTEPVDDAFGAEAIAALNAPKVAVELELPKAIIEGDLL
jgi:hypothetical protein